MQLNTHQEESPLLPSLHMLVCDVTVSDMPVLQNLQQATLYILVRWETKAGHWLLLLLLIFDGEGGEMGFLIVACMGMRKPVLVRGSHADLGIGH